MNTLNIKSITRVVFETVTTGPTGNIATREVNDGFTFVLAAHANGGNAFIRIWVNSQSKWFLTVIDSNTGETVNDSPIVLRYLVLKLYKNN